MVIDEFIFKNNNIMLSSYFAFLIKTGEGLPEKGVSFYCVYKVEYIQAMFG